MVHLLNTCLYLAEKIKYNFDNEDEINSEDDEPMEVNGLTSTKSDEESFKMSGSDDDDFGAKKTKAPVVALTE